jgi:MFS family permease
MAWIGCPAVAGTRAAYRDVLTISDARSLIVASFWSQLGDWLYNAALLAYVFVATGSAAWVGAATIVRLLPFMLLGPIGGAIADRFDRRKVLLFGDVIRFALMLVLTAVVWADGPIAVVIALTAVASAAGTAERPSAIAMLPRIVGEARIGPANALLHTVQDVGVVIGPGLGALILAFAPIEWAFVANAATFAISAAFVSTMRASPPPAGGAAPDNVVSHVVDGFRTARATPFALPLLLVVGMVEFTYGAQTVQLVLYAEQQLDLGPSGYGWLLAASGVGGLLSVLVNHRLSTSHRVAAIVTVTGVMACATQLVYAGTDVVAVALAVTVVGGIGLVACEVVAETVLARITPGDSLGRVMGVFDALSVAAMIVGALLAAVLVEVAGLTFSLVALGGGSVAVVLGCRAALRSLDDVSRQRAAALAARVEVIERLPMVAGAPRLVIELLAAAAQLVKLPAGVDIVVEGSPAHAFYALVDGRVAVHRDEQVLAELTAGGHFGERGLLDNAPRNASVTTQEDSTVLRIEGEAFLEALQTSPTMLSAIDPSNRDRADVSSDATPLVDDPTWRSA